MNHLAQDVPFASLPELVDEAARRYAGAPLWVSIDDGTTISFSEFARATLKCANALLALGVTPGAHVALRQVPFVQDSEGVHTCPQAPQLCSSVSRSAPGQSPLSPPGSVRFDHYLAIQTPVDLRQAYRTLDEFYAVPASWTEALPSKISKRKHPQEHG